MMRDNVPTRNTLRIWQQNINVSLLSQLDLLNFVDPNKYDLIVIQEPHLDFLTNTRSTDRWRTVLPTPFISDRSVRMRSMILMSDKLCSTGWEAIEVESYDISAVRIVGKEFDIFLFNAYNDCENSNTIRILERTFRKLERTATRRSQSILLGDFNRHHPIWDEERNHHLFTAVNLNEAQLLLDLIADYDLIMTLPPKVPTLCAMSTGNYTRVDNVFVSADIAHYVDRCTTIPEARPARTDHMPILTELDFTPQKAAKPQRWNWSAVDWEDFRGRLEAELLMLGIAKEPTNPQELDANLDDLVQAILRVIDVCVPKLRISSFTKRWWNERLSEMRKQMRHLARQS